MTTASHVLIASIALCLGSASVAAAESYDNCVGFIDSLPATISTQGVWCLRDDLSTSMASGNAITIANNNVTIDCNDFKLGGMAAGDASTAIGIYAQERQNATVRNCNVRGFFVGIYLYYGAGHLAEDNRLDNNLRYGIAVFGGNSLVQRNRVFDTGGSPASSASYGIGAEADVIDNTVAGVFATDTNTHPRGIVVYGSGSEARGNRVRGLVVGGAGNAIGIEAKGSGITLADNRVSAEAATAGDGINGDESTFCTGNTAVNFATAYDGCGHVFGNLSAP